MYKKILLGLLFVLPLLGAYHITIDTGDRIVAVVNDRIILKSDVDLEVSDYLRQMRMSNQPADFDESLWYDVLESVIDNYVLLEKAQMDSIEVSDDLVDRQMDLRIQQMVQQAGSEQAVEEAFGISLIELRAEHRQQFREQIIAQQVRETKLNEINITRPEVRDFFESIPADSLPMIPEMVSLSQIVVIPPPLEDAEREARERANEIRDSILTHGEPFEEMARKYSTGPSARNGGLLPMMPMSDLVSEYAAAAAALEPGDISEVVRSSFGYHIIRLNRRSGENIETNNILITIDDQGVDEQAAIQKLEAIRDSILHEGSSFSEMARRHSEDEFTQNMGGRVVNEETGDRYLALNNLDPSLYRVVLLLDEEGEISEPRPFTTRTNEQRQAYRIIRLDEHIPEHQANLEQDYERLHQFALRQKQMTTLRSWISDIREEVYVEYKIDVPDRHQPSQPELYEPETPTDYRIQ